ncbi:MAG: hypothetical protein K0R29_2623 [Pseudobdellovibrio sp.]|jgi:parvulin-like peptidyl-prolyl isomerase|nr:hypothetical protein [Pseudobdellovibrio sp.]
MSEKRSPSSVKSYKAAHILVDSKYQAEDLLKKLKTGSEFSELARKFSSCASAPHGGDLGEIRVGRAHEDFETAVLKLKPGQITEEPVRTPFGYHIILRLA